MLERRILFRDSWHTSSTVWSSYEVMFLDGTIHFIPASTVTLTSSLKIISQKESQDV